MILVLGLGNPGKQYEKSRHNVGFSVIDAILKCLNIQSSVDAKHNMEKASTVINGEKVMLVKPLTFMNNSGDISPYFRNENIDMLIVAVDNMDLDVGKARLKYQGSSAGHNGLKSIMAHFGNNFYRLYIGVGHPSGDVKDYVLSKITGSEKLLVDERVDRAARVILDFIADKDLERAQRELSL